jgi:hypothetical protein
MPTELKLQKINFLLKKINYKINIKDALLSKDMVNSFNNYILLKEKISSIYKMDIILNKKIKVYKYFNSDYYNLLGFKSIFYSYKYENIPQIIKILINFRSTLNSL